MWKEVDVLASSSDGFRGYIRDIPGARAVSGYSHGIGISGIRLQLGEIMLEWSTVTGDLDIVFDRQEDRKTFLLLREGAMLRPLWQPEPGPVSTAAFPTERPEHITLKSGSAYVIISIPNSSFRSRLSSLLGAPTERRIMFANFPDSELESLKVLREQVFQLPSAPLFLATELMGSRNQSLVNLIVDCFLVLYPNNYTRVLAEAAPTIAPKHVKRALDYIHSHPHQHNEPQVLADLSSVSKRTLQYSFQSTTGTTISEYQRLLRLRRAYDMVISSPEIPLKVIAGMWGFGSQAAFGQSFKKAFGIAPSEARRNKEVLGTDQQFG